MLAEMSWRQFTEWAAFFQLEPFGYPAQQAAQVRIERKLTAWFASVVQALYNIFTRKDGMPAKPRDQFEIKWVEADEDAPSSVAGPAPKRARDPESLARQSRALKLIAEAYARK